MNDARHKLSADQTQSELTPTRLTKSPLSRRTFIGWLGLLSASLGLSGSVLAQGDSADQQNDAQAEGAGTGTLGLGIIGLHVTNLGASLDFYRRLGLDIPTNIELSSGAFRLRLPTGQIFFWETIAYTRADFPDYEPGTGHRKVSLEFGFRNAREVDEMYNALLAEGYGSYAEPLSWGSIRYAGVVDPDNNQIALRFPLAS